MAITTGPITEHRTLPEQMPVLLSQIAGYVGGVFLLCEASEMFDRFEANLATGQRMWWDDTSPEWITVVAGTGTPFYTRLVPGRHSCHRCTRSPTRADRSAAPEPQAGLA